MKTPELIAIHGNEYNRFTFHYPFLLVFSVVLRYQTFLSFSVNLDACSTDNYKAYSCLQPCPNLRSYKTGFMYSEWNRKP